MIEALAREVWERKRFRSKVLSTLLLPAAFLYAGIVQLRNACFRIGCLPSARLPRPVVSIGNLTVGGTGKTPVCLWLANELQERGFRVGVLSRGYRRHGNKPQVLTPGVAKLTATERHEEVLRAGDEPLMMARLYGRWVGVGADRRRAAEELLGCAEVDVFILDDGFQHRWVKRDVEILLLGADPSGRMLPAGPFREPRRNLRRADFLLATGAREAWSKFIPRRLRDSTYSASLRPVCLIGLDTNAVREYPLTLLCHSRILTVTGVADPRGLYRVLHDWEGEIVRTLEFPDHHLYTTADWQEINRMARLADLIITTEKDILKLGRFPFAKDKLMALRVAMEVENAGRLVESVVEKIRPRESRV